MKSPSNTLTRPTIRRALPPPPSFGAELATAELHRCGFASVSLSSTPKISCGHERPGATLWWAAEGRVGLAGILRPCRPSALYLLPPHTPIQFRRAPRAHQWEVGCVEFLAAQELTSNLLRPTVLLADAWFLRTCAQGWLRECSTAAHPSALARWAEMLRIYIARLTIPLAQQSRLAPLWDAVRKNPARPWSIQHLADLVCLSPEHLRRLCHHETATAPMQQVALLRMRRACELLETTDLKISAIGRAVGYPDPAHFSFAFKRILRRSPATHRNQRQPKQ